jgi:hypothetical protein
MRLLVLFLFMALGLMSDLSLSALTIQLRSPLGPVGQQEVDLFVITDGSTQPSASQKSDRRGRLIISGLPASGSTFVVLRSVYQGAVNLSDLIPANSESYTFQLFPAASSAESVSVEDLRLSIEEQDEVLRVSQEWVIHNQAASIFMGDPASGETFSFKLPAQAFDVQMGRGFDSSMTEIRESQIFYKQAIPPGRLFLSLEYSLEVSPLTMNLNFQSSLPIELISLATSSRSLLPKTLEWTEGPRKIFNSKVLKVFSAPTNRQLEVNFDLKGTPLGVRFSQWLPVLILLILSLAAIFLPAPQIEDQKPAKASLLKRLKNLESERRAQLLSDDQYQLRRLETLEKLWPLYEQRPQSH